MASGATTGLTCSSCGAPLAPAADDSRATCAFCGTVNDIASVGAVKVARKLEQSGSACPTSP